MGSHSRFHIPVPARALATSLAILLVAGCGSLAPTSPASAPAALAVPPEPAAPRLLLAPGASSPARAPAWTTVAQSSVYPLQDRHVHGSRYDVHFLPGSLSRSITATIQQYDPAVVDFQLGPHGTKFLVPVIVTVDYAGTNADPSSPNYDGSLPVLLWWNPTTGLWELVAGVNEPLTRHYVVVLTHFSRYALAGRAGGTAEW